MDVRIMKMPQCCRRGNHVRFRKKELTSLTEKGQGDRGTCEAAAEGFSLCLGDEVDGLALVSKKVA